MRAACWEGRKSVRVENVPDPKILNGHDAIVRITSTAICGSDLHLYNGFIPAMERGDILGHEFMGEVVEVGPSVRNLRIGDRVVVPFPIACGECSACRRDLFASCENSNPNAWMAEKLFGHSPAGIFGYSHLTGGFAGGQAEFARVPFADIGPLKVPDGLTDDQALFLSDIFPTGYMAAENANIQPGDTVAVWGCGPVGQFAIASAFLLGAERVIAIDRFHDERRRASRRPPCVEPDLPDISVLQGDRGSGIRGATPRQAHVTIEHAAPSPPHSPAAAWFLVPEISVDQRRGRQERRHVTIGVRDARSDAARQSRRIFPRHAQVVAFVSRHTNFDASFSTKRGLLLDSHAPDLREGLGQQHRWRVSAKDEEPLVREVHRARTPQFGVRVVA